MADRYENDLLARENVDDIGIDSDYIRTLDENGVSYKDDMAKIAEVFLENYKDSSLGGSQQSVKEAFDDAAVKFDTRTCTANEWGTLLARLNTYK